MPAPPKTSPPRYDFNALLNGDDTDANTLRNGLIDARARTRALTDDLEDGRHLGPRLTIVNPPLWELGHVAWFQEFWCLRFRNGAGTLASQIENPDPIYDSAIAAHDTRWDLPLLPWRQMRNYQDAVLERVLERLERGAVDDQLRYFVLLSIFHEDMHGEAFYYTRQTLRYSKVLLDAQEDSAKVWLDAPKVAVTAGHQTDIFYAGGALQMGARRNGGFVFDNELCAHEVPVAPFAMASVPVTIAAFAAFVNADGYSRDDLWSTEGRTWRDHSNAQAPLYWHKREGQWWVREFDLDVAIEQREDYPMLFVNAHEAHAYCRWAHRRLPTEAEWEFAAKHSAFDSPAMRATAESGRSDVRPTVSNSNSEYAGWHWTADAFEPYPGFTPGPYAEYSAPWFGDHRALRGFAYPTRVRLRRPSYRNFYKPDRRDVLAGFRTCAIE